MHKDQMHTHKDQRLEHHQRFQELAALAQGRGLTPSERVEIENHLQRCDACRRVHEEYLVLHNEGMTFLAAAHDENQGSLAWDHRAAGTELFGRIRDAEFRQAGLAGKNRSWLVALGLTSRGLLGRGSMPKGSSTRWVTAAAAACLVVGVAAGAYHVGRRAPAFGQSLPSAAEARRPAPASQIKETDEIQVSQSAQIDRLLKQIGAGRQDIAELRSQLRTAQDRSLGLSAANGKKDELFQQVSTERDRLADQLRDAEKSYQLLRAELTDLRAEHDRTLLHTASLESKVEELSAASHDQDRRLNDDEQYLASDRDIRELMGARKLYIADVFDVDSGSHTRKPFGRVFYTQDKSLIFYAFDLDREPGIKNASAFQVWGQRDAETSEKPRPMNLGILYMDSETNRRWVLRLDDPKQLAEIDAVFVTVEPHGGSQKPTGKPFLYALLRKEANHP